MQWMIYGANGYSAQLIAQEAVDRGHSPILAGRNRDKVELIAAELGLPSSIFSLDNVDAAAEAMADVDLVIHCAGPFSATSAPMIEACLQSKTHYFDITGEIDVFENAHSEAIATRAKEAGIIICPGVGFDVIPTDCVAATLAESMPDAVSLSLGFDSGASLSPGTAKTSVEGLALGSKARVNGELKKCSVAHKVRNIDFGRGKKFAMTIPWGDISTAYVTTGIPNIDTFIPAKPIAIPFVKLSGLFKAFFKLAPVQNYLKNQIEKKVIGPDTEARRKARTWVWGEVKNAAGEVKQAYVETPNGYDVTVYGPLAIVEKLAASQPEANSDKMGSITPALLMGSDFISQLPETSPIKVV